MFDDATRAKLASALNDSFKHRAVDGAVCAVCGQPSDRLAMHVFEVRSIAVRPSTSRFCAYVREWRYHPRCLSRVRSVRPGVSQMWAAGTNEKRASSSPATDTTAALLRFAIDVRERYLQARQIARLSHLRSRRHHLWRAWLLADEHVCTDVRSSQRHMVPLV